MYQSITLNLPYDLSAADRENVATVFRSMEGWQEDSEQPSWFGQEGEPRYIWASVEPSGLLLEGNIEPTIWTGWLTLLCARLSLRLGREIHDAEM